MTTWNDEGQDLLEIWMIETQDLDKLWELARNVTQPETQPESSVRTPRAWTLLPPPEESQEGSLPKIELPQGLRPIQSTRSHQRHGQ
jgi:hypothetical protein